MKKILSILLSLLFVLALIGCGKRTMNDIIENEPSITGVVYEVGENYCMIESDGAEYQISLDVENSDSYTSLSDGDEIVVYYDGSIAESYPMQIHTVYAITLKTPAERTENKTEDSDAEDDMPILTSMTIHAQGICQNLLAENIVDTGLYNDMEALMWLVPRGALNEISTVEPEQKELENAYISESSETFREYSSQTEEEWYFDFEGEQTWIRLNYQPYTPPEGVNTISHEDILFYVDGENLYFAVQDVNDAELWKVTEIRDYGSWLQREIQMFIRLYMGL